jgi:mannosyltransferase
MTATVPPRVAPTARTSSRHPLVAVVGIGIFAFLLSVIAIATPSVWYDEAATITSATRSWPQLWAELQTVDAVHAVYYAFMHLVFDVFGYSPFTLRLPSAIAIGVAAAFTVVLGRQLGRARLGIVGALVFAVLPRTIWAGGEGRSYAITAALAVILTVALVWAGRSGRRKPWVVYGALVLVSCFVFIYLALIVVAHFVTIVIVAAGRRQFTPALRRPWLAAVASALYMLGQTGQIAWIHPLGWDTVHDIFFDQWFVSGTVFAVIGWALLVLGSVTLVRSFRKDESAAVLVPLVIVPTVALVVVSAVAFPVYVPRYLAMCLPFVALVIAAAIPTIPWRPARIATVALIAVLAVSQLVTLRGPEAKESSAWAEVASVVDAEKTDDTAIVYGNVQLHPTATARVVQYAYPDAFAGTVDATVLTSAAASGRLWETRAELANSLDRIVDADQVLLITSDARDLIPSTTATLGTVGWHESERFHFTYMTIVKFERN